LGGGKPKFKRTGGCPREIVENHMRETTINHKTPPRAKTWCRGKNDPEIDLWGVQTRSDLKKRENKGPE